MRAVSSFIRHWGRSGGMGKHGDTGGTNGRTRHGTYQCAAIVVASRPYLHVRPRVRAVP